MEKGKSDRKNKSLPIGGYVLTYNKWTGFDDKGALGRFFREMTIKEIETLGEGDIVWKDEDPIHPNGKVYGFIKLEIDRVERLECGRIRIHYDDIFTTVDPEDGFSRLFVVESEDGLVSYISANPLATRVLTEESEFLGKAMGVF